MRWRTEALLMLLRTTTHFGCCCEVSSLKSPGESKERLRVTKCRGRTDCFAKREILSRGRTIHRYNSRQHSGGCLSIALIIMRNNSNHKTMMTRYCAHTIGMYVLKYHCPRGRPVVPCHPEKQYIQRMLCNGNGICSDIGTIGNNGSFTDAYCIDLSVLVLALLRCLLSCIALQDRCLCVQY